MRRAVVAVLALCALAAVAVSAARVTDEVRAHFKQFVARHEKLYGAEDYERRLAQFAENLERIAALQARDSGAVYGVTKFADLHPSEFRRLYLSPMGGAKRTARLPELPLVERVEDTPSTWDWTTKGVVTGVKDQGQCGSCWAFSTTGCVEGAWAMAGNKLASLSEQQLVDCVSVDQGCDGGEMTDALAYIATESHGLESESSYPYTARDGKCKFSASKIAAHISSWARVSSNETQMAAVSYAKGPLAVALNADFLQFYSGGIANPSDCDPSQLDHGVLITGWGAHGSTNYWSVKNSWGSDWGENGYFRLVRGTGKCGINTDVSSATA